MKAPAMAKVSGTVLIAVCLVAFGGCGETSTACRVTGQVFINQKPAAGVYVLLQPAEPADDKAAGQAAGAARTGDDGTFTLVVPEPGQYVVNAFWPEVITTSDEVVEGEDRFRGRYRDPKRPIATVQITAPELTLPPIELTFRK